MCMYGTCQEHTSERPGCQTKGFKASWRGCITLHVRQSPPALDQSYRNVLTLMPAARAVCECVWAAVEHIPQVSVIAPMLMLCTAHAHAAIVPGL